MSQKILFVVTSNGKLGDTGKNTGYWVSEVTHPWTVLTSKGYEIDFVSPLGGKCPSEGNDPSDEVSKAFHANKDALAKIENTLKPSDVIPEEYCAIFYAGGHGVMWDFPGNEVLAGICAKIYENGGVVGAICHGPAGLVNVKLSNGKYLVDGKMINSFTNAEEIELGLELVVPFLLQTKLEERGALFELSDMWTPHVVCSDRIVTGQNPMSGFAIGYAIDTVLKTLNK